jgi:hypothetical protein
MALRPDDMPERCPRGHALEPGKVSLSWNMQLKAHWLYCGTCGSRILLGVEGAEWEMRGGVGSASD